MFRRIKAAALCLALVITLICPAAAEENGTASAAKPENPVQTPQVNVAAKSAILIEASTGKVLYEKNSEEFLNPASVTKTMTMLLIMEALDRGEINYDTIITASERAAAMGGSQIWLKVGEQMSVKDLLKAIAIVSGNDAATAMAEKLGGSVEGFVDKMNARAKELGCKNTNFVNPTGLDAEGHGTCARDLSLISRELTKHKEIREYTLSWMDNIRNGQSVLVNTNKLIKTYNGITGLKTGSTSQAKYSLSATAERDGTELIAVVVCSPTSAERFGDAVKLLDYGYANYKAEKLPAVELAPVKVIRGKLQTVGILCDNTDSKVLIKKSQGQITADTQLPEDLKAPVIKGQVVGKITYKCGEDVVAEYDLKAAQDVKEIGFPDIFFSMISVLMLCSKR